MDAQDNDKVWSDTVTRESAAEKLAAGAHRPAVRPRGTRMQPLVMVLLAFAGVVLIWIIGVTFVQWRAQVAAQENMRLTQEAMQKAQQQAEQLKREAAARQEELRAAEVQLEEQKVAAFKEQERAAEAARRAQAEAADRKEKAWARYYRPPPHCDSAATVDCTNRYIRAKRAFEERYAKGAI